MILTGVMILEFMRWQEAADLITKGLNAAFKDQQVTYHLARPMEPPFDHVTCRGFADTIIRNF